MCVSVVSRKKKKKEEEKKEIEKECQCLFNKPHTHTHFGNREMFSTFNIYCTMYDSILGSLKYIK